MRLYRVELSDLAEQQLLEIESYIARESSAGIAHGFAHSLFLRCQSLKEFPLRGTPRDDVRPGLRSIPHERNATIFYAVEGETVTVIAISYAGRDIATALRDPLN